MTEDILELEPSKQENYLGSPDVVSKIVQGFCDKVYDGIMAKVRKESPEGELTDNLLRMARAFSDVFMGKNTDYLPVRGWNCEAGLGETAKRQLAQNWEKRALISSDDPLQVLFGWLVVNIFHAIKEAGGDPDIAGMYVTVAKMKVINTLMGL